MIHPTSFNTISVYIADEFYDFKNFIENDHDGNPVIIYLQEYKSIFHYDGWEWVQYEEFDYEISILIETRVHESKRYNFELNEKIKEEVYVDIYFDNGHISSIIATEIKYFQGYRTKNMVKNTIEEYTPPIYEIYVKFVNNLIVSGNDRPRIPLKNPLETYHEAIAKSAKENR